MSISVAEFARRLERVAERRHRLLTELQELDTYKEELIRDLYATLGAPPASAPTDSSPAPAGPTLERVGRVVAETVDFVREAGGLARPREVAAHFRLTHEAASVRLRRATQAGLLKKQQWGVYVLPGGQED